MRPVWVVAVIWPTLGFATPEARAAALSWLLGNLKLGWLMKFVASIRISARPFPLGNAEGLANDKSIR